MVLLTLEGCSGTNKMTVYLIPMEVDPGEGGDQDPRKYSAWMISVTLRGLLLTNSECTMATGARDREDIHTRHVRTPDKTNRRK